MKFLIVNTLIIALAVMIHYEILYRLSVLMPKLKVRAHSRVVIGVFGAIFAHIIEIWLFALSFYFMHHNNWGQLSGNYDGSLMASAYFSFTTFTTLGFGDIEPLGDLRYLTGIESLTGLVLITWSASFLFYEMQKYGVAIKREQTSQTDVARCSFYRVHPLLEPLLAIASYQLLGKRHHQQLLLQSR